MPFKWWILWSTQFFFSSHFISLLMQLICERRHVCLKWLLFAWLHIGWNWSVFMQPFYLFPLTSINYWAHHMQPIYSKLQNSETQGIMHNKTRKNICCNTYYLPFELGLSPNVEPFQFCYFSHNSWLYQISQANPIFFSFWFSFWSSFFLHFFERSKKKNSVFLVEIYQTVCSIDRASHNWLYQNEKKRRFRLCSSMAGCLLEPSLPLSIDDYYDRVRV